MTAWKKFMAGGGVGVLLLLGLAQSQPPSEPAGDESPVPAETAAYHDIVETAKAFDAAYNAHDADAVARLFTERAELVDEDGVIQGRDAIRDAFAEVFTDFPEGTIRTEVDGVRFPGPGLAIEEGRTFVLREPDGPELERGYIVIHARRDDRWEMASVQDAPAEEAPTLANALADLEWLVGDWIDESDDSTVETSCRWSDDGNWLLQDYVVHLANGPAMSGTQRIGWDPSRHQIRSWSFDSEGGFIEGVWTFDGTRWTAQINGVAADGAIGSATRVITPLGGDAYLLQTFHRVLDGESFPDSEVTVVRRPPANEATEGDSTPPADPADREPVTPSN